MIDWTKQQSKHNLCGYCIDVTCVCNGLCFEENNHLGLDHGQNRINHIRGEIKTKVEELHDLREALKHEISLRFPT